MRLSTVVAYTLAALLLVVTAALSTAAADDPEKLPIERQDRIVFIGNTFAERLQMFSHFETLLTTRLPNHDLSFRNLARSGDEVALRPRPLNFGDLHSHLREERADVIVACFGMNEAFAGPGHLDTFRENLSDFADSLRTLPYNGSSPAEVIFVSPIAHEQIDRIPMDPSTHNHSLELYTAAMQEYSRSYDNVRFIDLYTPTKEIMQNPSGPQLTINGIHLNDFGYWVVSQLMGEALGLTPRLPRIQIDAETGQPISDTSPVANVISTGPGLTFRVSEVARPLPEAPGGNTPPVSFESLEPIVEIDNLEPGRYALRIDGELVTEATSEEWSQGVAVDPYARELDRLLETINHKNQLWFYRYRAVNGEYIYGRRKEPFGVENFPGEMQKLEQMVRSEEHNIWSLVKELLYNTWRIESVERAIDPSLP
jgi:hypothetical protein